MTTEEAIRHIRDILAENNSIKPSMVVFELEKEALYMAIKALEKEPILDKIRAEIEKAVWEDVIVSLDGTDEVRIPCLNPDDVFEIIDKYKIGSD